MSLGARMLLEVILNTMNKKNVTMEKEERRKNPVGTDLNGRMGGVK